MGRRCKFVAAVPQPCIKTPNPGILPRASSAEQPSLRESGAVTECHLLAKLNTEAIYAPEISDAIF